MAERVPGPICTSRLGDDWIDEGTLCLSRSSPPGPCRGLERRGCVTTGVTASSPDKVKFDREHVYSMAPEAARKRAIDLQIIGGDYSRGKEISINNEDYLKRLIEIGSGGKRKVGVDSDGRLQFFVIRGGGEGFLPDWLSSRDSSNVILPGSTTSGATGLTFRFDDNDLLIVFSSAGSLISSARLERPLSITGYWTQKTADKVYDSWENKEVFIRKNTGFEIPYLGLGVNDGFRERGIAVDMHKQEDTNGCIFIVDPNTPDVNNKAAIAKFEPKLIKDILASVGKTRDEITRKHTFLGIMHVVEVK